MLNKLGNLIEKRPWLVVGLILVVTIGFGALLPSLEMQTSMQDFLPDDEVVNAEQRINDYFGAGYEMIMIYIEKQNANSVVAPEALKEAFFVAKELEKFDETMGIMSVAGFVDTICQMEFSKSLVNCSNDEINAAFHDLMIEQKNHSIRMMNIDDSNEEIDYNAFPRLSKGKTIDCMDIKNYYIEERDGKLCFSIEMYDLSHFESDLMPPHRKMNVMEWYIDFKNLIIPDERLDMEFTIAAHVEPTNQLWEIGKGSLKNFRELVSNVKNHELFKSYKKEAYLWIKPPGQEMSFPLKLETGDVLFNVEENRVEVHVEREELGKYGIAPEMEGFGLPARLGNSKAGVRFYQVPVLKLPWSRVSLNFSFLQKFLGKIQNRPVLSAISARMLSRFGDFSWEDFDDLFAMMNEGGFAIDKVSLKDMDSWWVVTDEAPDTGHVDNTFFIKPSFMKGMRKNVITFLSDDYGENQGASATLMMVQIDGSLDSTELDEISNTIVETMETVDSERDCVSMGATGYSIIENEINKVTMEANLVIVPMIFVVICLILFFSFRGLSYVFLPLIGLSIAIIWLFGTMVLLGMQFMIMEVALIPMLMGLGVDYSVHMFHNYRAELGKGKTPGEAIVASIQDIGMAMFLATITTFIAFLSFLTATMTPLRDFGVLCAIGIAYTFIITITLQAAVKYILDRRKKRVGKLKSKRDSNGKLMRKTARIVCRHPVTILLVTSVVTVIMVGGALQIQTGFRMEDFLPEENPSVMVMNDISEDFPFSSQEQEYILIEGDVATLDTLKGISKTYENFRDDEYVLLTTEGDPKAISILSVIQKAVEKNSSLAEEFNIGQNWIPRTNQDIQRMFDYLYDSNVYGYEVREMLHQNGNRYDATLISVYTSALGSDDEDTNNVMNVLYNDLNNDIAGGYGAASAIVTGETSMMYVIMNSMTESQILSTAICIILAAIVLIVAYRKPLLGLIAMIPVSISTIWIIGTMYFIGYSLNVMTVMITSMTIGLGITYAIHAVERFRLTADRTGDVIGAVSETIGHTGGALMIAAITTMAGFGMLVLTPMPVEQQFGVIMCLTILYAFLTSIFILPPVLMFWGRWKKKKKGYIISPKKPASD